MAELVQEGKEPDAAVFSNEERQVQTARLAAIVESSQDAIIGKTLDGVITSWNRGAERMYGYSQEEAVGRPISFLAPVERLEELGPIFERLRRGERIETFETVRVRKDGSQLNVLLTISPVLDSSGQIVEASAIAHDITEQKLAEQRKDEFLAMLGHELRNPLAAIRSSLHVLEAPAATAEQRTQVRRALDRQVAHLTRLVDDLLDVARISRGRILLREERLDLTGLIRGAVEDYRAAASAAGLELRMDLPGRPLWLTGDSTRIAQAVGNLLHNALKFTDRGGRIEVALAEADGRAGQAIIRVRDTGIGMDEATLQHLFEPFRQADSGLDRSRGGLGLGLALVKRLVELHGGSTAARSAGSGRGSEIEIRLPMAEQSGAPDPPEEPPAAGRPRRCLVIEDNADSAETLGLLLELAGHRVEVALDGHDGLDKARLFQPEVVLCDIGLPGGLDGYEVARRMRADPGLRGARLIALSGYGQEEDRRRAHEAGFDIHLTKPADPAILQRLLAEAP